MSDVADSDVDGLLAALAALLVEVFNDLRVITDELGIDLELVQAMSELNILMAGSSKKPALRLVDGGE